MDRRRQNDGSSQQEPDWIQSVFEQANYVGADEAEVHRKHPANSGKFNAAIGVVICLNAVMIGVELDHGRGDAIKERLPFFIAELLFGIVFGGEMLLRQHCDGWAYFLESWNVLDYHLVVLGFVDVVMSMIVQEQSDLKVMTAFRLIRMMRLVRNLRLLRMFRELWMIVRGFFDSLPTLGWVTVLLMLVTYTFAIYIVIDLGQDPGCAQEWEHCEKYIGTVPRAMFTLFQVISMSGWATNVVRPVGHLNGFMPWVFIFVLVICSFGVLNVIVGVIVERTMVVAQENEARVKKIVQDTEKLVMLSMAKEFSAYDDSGDAELDYDEFCEAIRSKSFAQKLRLIDVPLEEVEELFFLMDVDKSGTISAEEFVTGIQRVKGTAKGKDMIQLIAFVKCSIFRVVKLTARVEKVIEKSDLVLERLDEMWGMTEQELHEREWAVQRQATLKKRIHQKKKILTAIDDMRNNKAIPLVTKEGKIDLEPTRAPPPEQ